MASAASSDEPIPKTRVCARSLGTARLAVVIVNFCQWRNTARLVGQLRHSDAVRGGAARIVVIDNGSPRSRWMNKLRQLRGVLVVRCARNFGFATAVNRGAAVSDSDWLLLLNPDVSVGDGFLDDALAAAAKMPTVGVVGFQLRNDDATPQASAGPFPSFLRTALGLLRPRAKRKCRHHLLTERRPVAWVTGGCLLVRRDCFADLGGLDERFFLYYEDVDFCQRATARGWSVWYDPAVRLTHHSPLHARAVPAPLRLITRHALLTYAALHWPRWQSQVLNRWVRLEARGRQWLAARRGRDDDADCHRELRALACDLSCNRSGDVARRIREAARFLDRIAAAQDRRK